MALANIGLPPEKPHDPHPTQYSQTADIGEVHSPYRPPTEPTFRSPRQRKAESLPEQQHNAYRYKPGPKSEMGDNFSRIPISNITHRSKSRSRQDRDQSSGGGRRSKSSASSRVSKSSEARQKSSVQKV